MMTVDIQHSWSQTNAARTMEALHMVAHDNGFSENTYWSRTQFAGFAHTNTRIDLSKLWWVGL